MPKGYDLELSFYNYSKDLAFAMWIKDSTSVESVSGSYKFDDNVYRYKSKKESEKASESSKSFLSYFSNDVRTRLAREGAQLA